jgi:hypothetical protein
MKTLIITAAITLTSLFASANNIIVQSGKTVVKLDANRVAYVLSHTKNAAVRQALTNGMQTIRNNDQADIICAILKGKRN